MGLHSSAHLRPSRSPILPGYPSRADLCDPSHSEHPSAACSQLITLVILPAATPGMADMDTRDGFIDTIGNTPLIRLRGASEATGCTILGKAEFLNPGGSVKDRAALYIVKDAEERG